MNESTNYQTTPKINKTNNTATHGIISFRDARDNAIDATQPPCATAQHTTTTNDVGRRSCVAAASSSTSSKCDCQLKNSPTNALRYDENRHVADVNRSDSDTTPHKRRSSANDTERIRTANVHTTHYFVDTRLRCKREKPKSFESSPSLNTSFALTNERRFVSKSQRIVESQLTATAIRWTPADIDFVC